ncbi:DUF7662 domain-containing protein [Ancylobacter sp.]|uniref:DUF7662 domain-containing protein n=1 Tax=Ancylobacter sp. TaxID=1872567 RepID=UPI003BAD5F1D
MSKYSSLTTFLASRTQPKISMSFEDIERIVGSKLPQSAFNHRAWWSNNPTNSVMTKAWLAAGFRSEDVDMTARRLVFSRSVPQLSRGDATRVAPASTGSPLAGLFGGLKGTVHIEPGTDLTLPSTSPIYLYDGGGEGTPIHQIEPSHDAWQTEPLPSSEDATQEYNPSNGRDWTEEN